MTCQMVTPRPVDGLRLVDRELADIADHGLPDTGRPGRRVLILGAGMAGLVAAYELLRRGHEPVILEARRRIGGRIYTVRDFAPGLYAEAGAMRIPRVHGLTVSYCRRFGLDLRPISARSPNALVHVGGRRMRQSQVARDPSRLPFTLAQHECGRSYDDLWREATEEVRAQFSEGGAAALAALVDKYDGYSIRGFLKARGWSEGAIELYGVMTVSESTLNTSVIQEFREVIGGVYDDTLEIVGGMDRLPSAFYQHLRAHIHLGAEVRAVRQDGRSVTVSVRTPVGETSFTGDAMICTIPFSVLRGVDFAPALSRGKQKAIRQLHYDAATKTFFQVRQPFWEHADAIRGGVTVTDLPVRRIVYPSHVDPAQERAMLLASYTWGQDALRWSSMSPAVRTERALLDVAKIHPQVMQEFEAAFSYCWYQDPYAAGAYALFEPEQHSALYQDIVRTEGRIHFAGEHCSRWPAWIEGAVESGLRAAGEVHGAEQVAL